VIFTEIINSLPSYVGKPKSIHIFFKIHIRTLPNSKVLNSSV